ncbi:MAG: response regulator [Plectolyngbya sp. WJT66-NPBG17]|jgi:PAS domain S-box-containing protein|nr:response regulator [Plectolyngbya sp. WJT66-NPBG17]
MPSKFRSDLLARIFSGNSQTAQLMRSHNWADTSLGAIEHWSPNLCTALSICLNSRFPMVIWWGKELALLYNDAWLPILGNKHPAALGRPGHEVWAETWDVLGAQLHSVLDTGEATWSDDLLLQLYRYGYLEETYFTYSYSPIFLESGEVGGAFTAVTETTDRVIGERRLATLRDLAAQVGESKTIKQACEIAIETLANNLADVPFAAIYSVSAEGATLEAKTKVSFSLTDSFWKLEDAIAQRQPILIENLAQQFGEIPAGILATPLQQALVLPVWASGQETLSGLLVVGVNPGRALNENYRNFFEMAAGHIGTAIANADAYEAERKRVEALAELDRAKTEFFSNVSHEFRTPLTLMLNPLEEVLEIEPLEHRSQLETAHRNGLRLLKLVNTLLDFSRIEAGRVQAVYQPIELSTFTAELASVFRTTIERVGLRLIVNCEGDDRVYVDREMWEKIVLNLISNAFKFTFEGEIEIVFRRVGDSVELSIRDTGVGIPSEALPRLFERFHRVSGTRSRSYEGSGIGLALVKELVDQHGGTIFVSSQVEVGSTFTVKVPLGDAHLPREQVDRDGTLRSTTVRADAFVQEALRWNTDGEREVSIENDSFAVSSSDGSSRSTRILVVDDNADLRDYLKRLLVQSYSVETAIDGIDALNVVRRSPPDLILSDVMMPNLDGFGLLQKLRSQPETQEIPIILLSARAGEEARVEGLGAGADDYLVKPFSARELIARVESTLKLSQLRKETTDRERTLRSQAEVAQAQVETILHSIRDAFIVLDRDWRYVYSNQASIELSGMLEETFLGRCIWDVFPDLVDTEFHRQYHRAMHDQTVVEFEFFYPTWNRWFQHRIYPTPAGISAFVADITEQKQIELALIQSKERLKGALAAGRIVAWDWDAQTDEAMKSSNAAEILGIAPEDLITTGQKAESIIHPEDLLNHRATLAAAIIQGGNYVSRFRVIRPDNQEILWVEDRGTVYVNEPGIVTKIGGMITDISDRVHLEQERDLILQQEQVARREAERANRLKDEFLAVLSHELRTPLNPILGWVRLLRMGKCNPTQSQHALETIERNAKLQTQLIGDLLDVSRILQGKLHLAQDPVDLSETISAAIETVQLAADAKSLQIQTQINAAKPVIGDAGRLQQIIWNLLSNAVKFTPANGSIVVSLTEIDDFAHLQVSDNGKGIQPDFLPYVFDYFRQEDGSSTRTFGGLGLGLAIVRYLTELHGGIVTVHSAGEGQGATFTVKLPVANRTIDTPEETTPIEQSLQGYSILVIDDDRDSNALAAFVLRESGASVLTASSGMEALQKLNETPVDLVVSDIGMPELDGYELLQQIRANSISTPAIALTAYAGGSDQQRAIKAGFQVHLAKPIEPEQLLSIATTLLKNPAESVPQSLQSRMLY